jgi:hypothetical protein
MLELPLHLVPSLQGLVKEKMIKPTPEPERRTLAKHFTGKEITAQSKHRPLHVGNVSF